MNILNVINQTDVADKVSLYERIYIWSLITEPLLFFILSDGSIGVPITLSRLLQFIFLISFSLKCISNYKNTFIINPFSVNYKYTTLYVFLILVSSVIGVTAGLYAYDLFSFNAISSMVTTGVLPKWSLRPFFEVFILCYYFFYFLILPKYIIKSRLHLSYLFTWTIRVFYFVIVVGLIDVVFYYYGGDLIPRHLVDSRWVKVGLRFHGLAGEPRDAFVYLLFGLSILYLNSAIFNKALPSLKLIVIIIACLVLTQSFSGMLGLVFGAVLLLALTKLTVRDYVVALSFIFVVFGIAAIAAEYSARTQMYISMIQHLPQTITQKKLPYLVIVQSPDIVPLWLFLNKLINFDIYPIFFGSGIGSASFATNNFMNHVGVNNPRSQLARLLFESGIIGLYIYLLILVRPIQNLNKKIDKRYRVALWVSVIMLYGAVLGVRSNLGLIFAGISLSIYLNRLYERDADDNQPTVRDRLV